MSYKRYQRCRQDLCFNIADTIDNLCLKCVNEQRLFKKGGIVEQGEYKDLTIELPKGVEINSELVVNTINDFAMIGTPERETDRLKNLLTACYNCDSIKEVKKLIEAEIAREEHGN